MACRLLPHQYCSGSFGRALLLALAVLATPSLSSAADHKPPAIVSATDFPAVEVHPAEHLAIAVEPYDTPSKLKLFRVNYLAHGFMPVRVIITNTGNEAVSLKDARILFITAAGDRLQAAEPRDIERRMVHIHASSMPSPIPGLHLPHKDVAREIERDFDTLEFQALVVKPHSTEAGFLFYDVDGMHHPLQGSAINLHALRFADGRELFYFEIPFDKYLASHGHQMN